MRNADQLAAKWNEEADERKTIIWPEGQFIALQRKVKGDPGDIQPRGKRHLADLFTRPELTLYQHLP